MIFLVLSVIILVFGFVVFFGAPYLPTLNKQTETALDLLDLEPGQTLLELGSGDGRVMRAAAKRGIYTVGYELNPLLVITASIVTWRQRKYVTIIWGNYWQKDWPNVDGIFVFLIDKYMSKLNTRIMDYPYKPIRLVSFAFTIPGKKPNKSHDGLFLYVYR